MTDLNIDRNCPECGEYDAEKNAHLYLDQRHECPNEGCDTKYYKVTTSNDR